MTDKPRVLIYDVETCPAKVYAWSLFNVNISINQIIRPSVIICFSAKWLGEKEVFFASDWEDGHEAMIRLLYQLVSEADALVTYNGERFDNQKILGEFLLAGMKPPPPWTSIDVYKTVKKMGYQSGKLAYVGPLLSIGDKVKNEGFSLWEKVDNGDPKAQKRMKKYCIGDVTLLEKLYNRVKAYIKTHPHMGLTKGTECGVCGSDKLHSRGYRRTKTMKIQRVQCTVCGSWGDGKRERA